MAHYLVTGGAGFIGSHISMALVNEGHKVTVIDNLSTGNRKNLTGFKNSIQFIEGDIQDESDLSSIFDTQVDYVIHQAALPSVPRSINDPMTSHLNNVDGTLKLLIAARDAKVKRFVFASSSSVYGADPTIPKREDLNTIPKSPYALTKLSAETYCRLFHELYGLETVGLRYFNVFGPRQNPKSQYSAVIPLFIDALLSGKTPVIYSDGEQSRDFTFVANVVQANLKACIAPDAPGKAYNVACGDRTTVNKLYHAICELLGIRIEPEYKSSRPGDVRHSHADITRITNDLGYKPEIDFMTGLKKTVSYYKESFE